MIVIVSKDKDFSHTLAEQVVRELGEPCECLEQASDMKALNHADIRLVIARETAPKPDKTPTLMVKPPLRMRELLANIQQLIKVADGKDEITFAGAFVFSLRQKELRLLPAGKAVGLTDKEGQLLGAILAAGSKGVAKDELLKAIWGFEADLNTHTLETHVYRLRAKFKDLSGNEMIAASENGYKLSA
jgi:hypothetical protein